MIGDRTEMSVVKTFGKYRNLLAELIKKDIKLKDRSSYLGIIWTLLEPLLTMAVLTLVFSGFLGKGTKDFPVYILTGRLMYSFFANGTKAALKSVRSNASMIKKVYVPKYMYPFASVLSGYAIFLISMAMEQIRLSFLMALESCTPIFASCCAVSSSWT